MFPSSPFYVGDTSKLEPLPDKNVILNPLKLFPAKNDTFTRAFFGVDAPKKLKQIENAEKWLHVDKIDPHYGIPNSSLQVESVRKTYRRMQSNKLFMPANDKNTSLSELFEPTTGPQKNFVVVEESRLPELIKFESLLRQERELLGEQCAWVLNDFQIEARFPVPATKLAIQNLCESEMRKLASKIIDLNQAWDKHAKQNHYDRPHLFLNSTYLHKAPLHQRAMKLRIVKAAAESWKLRNDRDTMQYEDELSYLAGKYLDAQTRRRDYDRYFTLASRYGVFSKEEFAADSFPGKRYYKRVLRGALKF